MAHGKKAEGAWLVRTIASPTGGVLGNAWYWVVRDPICEGQNRLRISMPGIAVFMRLDDIAESKTGD